jgi:hypothetical protein
LAIRQRALARLDRNIFIASKSDLLYTVTAPVMLTTEQFNTIHRLHWAEQWSVRKIARHLHLARRTISQYLATPARSAAPRQTLRGRSPSRPRQYRSIGDIARLVSFPSTRAAFAAAIAALTVLPLGLRPLSQVKSLWINVGILPN